MRNVRWQPQTRSPIPAWLPPAVIALGVAILALAVAVNVVPGDGGSALPLAPTAAGTRVTIEPAPEPTATPDMAAGAVPAVLLRRGEPVSFPGDVSMLVEHAAGTKEAPLRSLERWTNVGGLLQKEAVFDPGDGFITSAVAGGPGIAWVAVCAAVDGACDPALDQERSTRFHLSRDGGVTWSAGSVAEGLWHLVAATADGFIAANYENPEPGYAVLIDGELQRIERPGSASETRPPLWLYGQAAWIANDSTRLVAGSGTSFLKFDFLDPIAHRISSIVTGEAGTAAVAWYRENTSPIASPSYIARGELADRFFVPLAAVRVEDRTRPRPAAWLGDALIVTDDWASGSDFGYSPAILDFDAASLHFISEFQEPGMFYRVLSAGRGPFLRVSGTGSCLNIREEPSLEAPIVICLGDSVLLTDLGGRRTAEGVAWAAVSTPAGQAGWASVAFLSP